MSASAIGGRSSNPRRSPFTMTNCGKDFWPPNLCAILPGDGSSGYDNVVPAFGPRSFRNCHLAHRAASPIAVMASRRPSKPSGRAPGPTRSNHPGSPYTAVLGGSVARVAVEQQRHRRPECGKTAAYDRGERHHRTGSDSGHRPERPWLALRGTDRTSSTKGRGTARAAPAPAEAGLPTANDHIEPISAPRLLMSQWPNSTGAQHGS